MASHFCPVRFSPALQISLHPVSALYRRELFSAAARFNAPSKGTIQLLLSNKFFGPTMSTFSKFCCSNSLDNPLVETGALFSLFQEIGLGYEETEMLLANQPELAMISLDTLRARVRSLQDFVGFDRLALLDLVAKRPNVLTATEIDDLMSFLRDGLEGQISQAQMKLLLSDTEPSFFVGFDQKVKLLLNRGVPPETIVYVLNNVNLKKAVCYRSMDEISRTIDFLEPFGGINLIARRPVILNYDLDNQLIPRIEYLIKLSGGDVGGIGKMLQKLPSILNYRVEHVEGHVEFLRSFAGLNDQEIFRILMVFPALVGAHRERKLRPRIEFLKDCGLNSDETFKFLLKAPLFLSHSFRENIAHKLVLLVKIGYEYRTKDLAMAIGSTTRISCENLQKVIDIFLSYGLSCEDIVVVNNKREILNQYNHTSLEKKMKYLIKVFERDIDEL